MYIDRRREGHEGDCAWSDSKRETQREKERERERARERGREREGEKKERKGRQLLHCPALGTLRLEVSLRS